MATKQKGPWLATDASGREYWVVMTFERSKSDFFGGSFSSSGPATLTTTDGEELNYIAKGEYEFVLTGLRIKSTDPLAE
jgi:hypothetical protein